MSEQQSSGGGGVSSVHVVGMGLAAYASYTLGNPVGWICVHSIFGWFYLLYLCGGCGGGLPTDLFGAP